MAFLHLSLSSTRSDMVERTFPIAFTNAKVVQANCSVFLQIVTVLSDIIGLLVAVPH